MPLVSERTRLSVGAIEKRKRYKQSDAYRFGASEKSRVNRSGIHSIWVCPAHGQTKEFGVRFFLSRVDYALVFIAGSLRNCNICVKGVKAEKSGLLHSSADFRGRTHSEACGLTPLPSPVPVQPHARNSKGLRRGNVMEHAAGHMNPILACDSACLEKGFKMSQFGFVAPHSLGSDHQIKRLLKTSLRLRE